MAIEDPLVERGERPPPTDREVLALEAAKHRLLEELGDAMREGRLPVEDPAEAEELYDRVRDADSPEDVAAIRHTYGFLLNRANFATDPVPARRHRPQLSRPVAAGGLAVLALLAAVPAVLAHRNSQEAEEVRRLEAQSCALTLDYQISTATALAGLAHHQALSNAGFLEEFFQAGGAVADAQEALRPLMRAGTEVVGESAVELARTGIEMGQVPVYATTVVDTAPDATEWRATLSAVAADLREQAEFPSDVCSAGMTPPDAAALKAVFDIARTAAGRLDAVVAAEAARTTAQAARPRVVAARPPGAPARSR